MSIRELYEKLLQAKRPVDFFGSVTDEGELKKAFRNYALTLHPDKAADNEKYIANQAFMRLHELYKSGLDELQKGIYSVQDILSIYNHSDPIFELSIRNQVFKFYEHLFEGDVANIFRGVNLNNIVYLKVAKDSADNSLIDDEFNTLCILRHQSLPYVEKQLMINDTSAIIMREVKGINMVQLMEEYPKGVPAEHVMWMLERLFSVVGFLHSNSVIHGNIKPEHIIITKENHNVSLVGFSLCITKANTPDAKYRIINEFYTAPEVSKTARVHPYSDIYSLGKIALQLLGGDVKTNEFPYHVDPRIKTFIRKLINEKYYERPNDAWETWDVLRKLRKDVFGDQKFNKFD